MQGYEFDKQLGDNQTYIVLRKANQQYYVLKRYALHQKAGMEKLERVKALAHPHLLAPIEMGDEAGVPYAIYPYCPSGSCTKLMGSISEQLAWKITAHIATGLQILHDAGICHGNIKMNNILLNSDGKYVLTDYALDSAPHNDMQQLGSVLYQLVEGQEPNLNHAVTSSQMGAPVSDNLKLTIVSMLNTGMQHPSWEEIIRVAKMQGMELPDSIAHPQPKLVTPVAKSKPVKEPAVVKPVASSANQPYTAPSFEDRTQDDRLPTEPPAINILRWVTVIGCILAVCLLIFGVVRGIMWLNSTHKANEQEELIADSLAAENAKIKSPDDTLSISAHESLAYLDTNKVWKASDLYDEQYIRFVRMFNNGEVTKMKESNITEQIKNEVFVHLIATAREMKATDVRDVFVKFSEDDVVKLEKIDAKLTALKKEFDRSKARKEKKAQAKSDKKSDKKADKKSDKKTEKKK